MASSLDKLLSTLAFLSVILIYPSTITSQECPYPCYPPPTGPGNNPPVTTTPPAPPTPPANSLPPPVSISPPAGYLSFGPPPPYFFGAVPPPPDPIVPWFPYYYRKPPHQDQSSSPVLKGSTHKIIVFMFPLLLVFSFVFCY